AFLKQESVGFATKLTDAHEQLGQMGRNVLNVFGQCAELQLQKMPKTISRITQMLVCRVQFHVTFLRGGTFRLRQGVDSIGMNRGGELEKFFLETFRIQPWTARLIQQKEIIRHALKLSPQEQLVAAFGFLTLNPPCNAST